MEVDELFPLGNDKLIIGQLEIANAKEFLDGHKEEINNVLDAVRVEWGCRFSFYKHSRYFRRISYLVYPL